MVDESLHRFIQRLNVIAAAILRTHAVFPMSLYGVAHYLAHVRVPKGGFIDFAIQPRVAPSHVFTARR